MWPVPQSNILYWLSENKVNTPWSFSSTSETRLNPEEQSGRRLFSWQTAVVKPGQLGEYEALLGLSQTGQELVFPLFESTQLRIISHMVYRETRRPTFPSVPNHTHGAVTNSEPRALRTPVVSLISNDQRPVRVSRKAAWGEWWLSGQKVEAMNEVLLRITWILVGGGLPEERAWWVETLRTSDSCTLGCWALDSAKP